MQAGRKPVSQKGNIGDLLATGLCVLAMTVLMLAFLHYSELIHRKTQIGQAARRYILKMETTGYLTEADRAQLIRELEELGVTQIDLSGTTTQPAGYGSFISLCVRGKLEGSYDFSEKRVSTAKY